MLVVQGLVVQFLFWRNLPLNNFYFRFGQRDHYLLGEVHSLTKKLPTSCPLFSSSLLSLYFIARASLETETCVVFWNACAKKMEAGRGYLSEEGRAGQAPLVGGRAPTCGAHRGCPFLHSLLCLTFKPKNNSMVVGRWKSAG